MAIDEFGREIPSGGGGLPIPLPSDLRSPIDSSSHHLPPLLSASFEDRLRSRSPDNNTAADRFSRVVVTSRYRDEYNSRAPPLSPRGIHYSDSRRRDDHRHGADGHTRSESRSVDMETFDRGGKRARLQHGGGRSPSPRPSPPANRGSPESDSEEGKKRRRKPHPVERYVEDRLLCEFLWRQEIGSTKDDDPSPLALSTIKDESPCNDDDGVDDDTSPNESYQRYVANYCLNYVRNFFNYHLDDSWFRSRYSPLERKRETLVERNRAAKEAGRIKEEIATSLEEFASPRKISGKESCSFVMGVRLGGGVKPCHFLSSSTGSTTAGGSNRKRKYNSTTEGPEDAYDGVNTLPKSHLFSFVRANAVVKIIDVPPHVADSQILFAVSEHCDQRGGTTGMYSSPVIGVRSSHQDHQQHGNLSLHRSCWVLFESESVKDKMLDNLNKANMEANNRHQSSRDSRDAPKLLELNVDCTDPYGRYEIDADGRGNAPPTEDFDSDNDYGAAGDNKKASTVPKVPIRRTTVFVSTSSVLSAQPVTVLSAAVSSAERIGRDKAAAVTIARALDVARSIPRGSRLDDLLETLFPNLSSSLQEGDLDTTMLADILDASIAYLRRVHLFSFYNGCTMAADGIGSVLGGHHPAGTIHLRLKGADEILKKAAVEEHEEDIYGDLPMGNDEDLKDKNGQERGKDAHSSGASSTSTDLLVRRLDESISKALEESTARMESSSFVVVDERIDAMAKEIEALEDASKNEWVENHALIDDDGRARCSFHFCKKLFKDRVFLNKHLLKKHPEYLNAEIGKCHDSYMMKLWDEESHRPVPPILVDCGSSFGLVPSTVVGRVPMAMDPEPELWRREQERRTRIKEEEMRYREKRAAAAAELDHRNYNNNNEAVVSGGVGTNETGPSSFGGGSNFVDVDDMKDEKVQLSFENVEIPVSTTTTSKKKKKKKKLL